MKNIIRGENMRKMLVFVDSYEDGTVGGRLSFPSSPDEIRFASLMQMLISIEEHLDAANFPQSYSKMRIFTSKSPHKNRPEPTRKPKCGEIASFSLRILFRQNASWQGYVSWLDGGIEESFRSALELVFLLNSALAK